MPYQVYHEDGEWVVRKKNPDGTPGKIIGHHGQDKAKAEAQLRALYASEGPNKNSIQYIFSNAFRSVTLDGREWLVVPGVPLREQVMNNYLVPADEISRAVVGWNGTPISIAHPQLNGGSVNVPAPDVGIIGKFFDAKFDAQHKRMVGDYWIDVESAGKYAEGALIVEAIRNGKVLETSTGYWAEDEPAVGEFNGRQYKTIHRNLLPDHIAILTKEIGACSVKDGCGLNRNSAIFQNCESCDCPFKNNSGLPPYVKDHLPTEMLIGYCYNKGARTQEQLNGMRAYIQANGIDKPVMVLADEDQIRIVDGNHRVALAGELGIDQVPVKVFNEDLQPVDPEILYTQWVHAQDQSYLNQRQASNLNANAEVRKKEADGEHPAGHYLVVEDPKSPSTWHLRVRDVNGDPDRGLMGAAWAALHGGYRGNKYEGPDKQNAIAELTALYKQVKAPTPGEKSNAMNAPENVKNHPMYSDELYQTMLKRKMTPGQMVEMMDGMKNTKTNSFVHLRVKSPALKIQKKESVMKFEELQTLLQTKGITLNAGEGDDFVVEETPVTEPEGVPGLSAEEITALKALAATAPKLSAQAEKLDKLDGALAMAQNYEAQQKAEKEALMAQIKANSSSLYTDEELNGMAMPVLIKLNASMNVNYGALAGAGNLFQNEEVLVVPSSLLSARKEE